MSTCNNLLIVSYEQMLHIETGASIPCDSSTLHITRKGNEAQGFQGWSKHKAWTGGMETGG